MSIDNLKLRTKTLIPLVLMALVVTAMVAFGAIQLSNISGKASEVIEHRDMAAVQLIRASRGMFEAPYSVFGALLYDGDSPEGRTAAEGFPKAISSAESLLGDAMKLAPDKAAEIAKFRDRFQPLMEKAKRVVKIGQGIPALSVGRKLKPEELDQFAEGATLMADIDMQTRSLIGDIVTFNNALLAENAQAAADLRAQSTNALVTLIVVGLFATLLAGAFALWLSSSKIARPLARLAERMRALAKGDLAVQIEGQDRRDEVGDMAQAVQVFKENAVERVRLEAEAAANRAAAEAERERTEAERRQSEAEQTTVVSTLADSLVKMAKGDLSTRIEAEFKGRYQQIKTDFNAAIARLEEAMQAVTDSTHAIQAGTEQMSTAADDLSRRTEQQAASLEETAAALEEITSTVKKSAEGATHARQVVAAADEDAKKSALVVRQAVEAMDAIAKSAQQISQIIGVIDEIAFQTNLLALNAGVEAARAGDAGRGFAVVASEVRALAQRSAEAAKEIKGLITASTRQVESGVKLVGETGQSLDRIMAQVAEINSVVGDIAAGAKEQATGVGEVNTAINQMDQMTQQNSAMVEESTAATHSLSQETAQLSGLIGQFQLGRTGNSDSMRRELQKVAPHAFRQLPKAAVPKSAPAETRGAARPVHAMPKAKVANGGPVGAGEGDWKEF